MRSAVSEVFIAHDALNFGTVLYWLVDVLGKGGLIAIATLSTRAGFDLHAMFCRLDLDRWDIEHLACLKTEHRRCAQIQSKVRAGLWRI